MPLANSVKTPKLSGTPFEPDFPILLRPFWGIKRGHVSSSVGKMTGQVGLAQLRGLKTEILSIFSPDKPLDDPDSVIWRAGNHSSINLLGAPVNSACCQIRPPWPQEHGSQFWATQRDLTPPWDLATKPMFGLPWILGNFVIESSL